jgi:small-conductance mechanosensitive channel
MYSLLAETTDTLGGTAQRTQDTLASTFQTLYTQTMLWLPNAIVAVVVLLVGYVVARLVAKLVTTLGEKINLQYAAERGGLADSLKQIGVKRSVPAIFGTVVFWTLIVLFVMSAANALGFQEVSKAMDAVFGYMPNVLGALIIMVVGLLAASFLRGIVAASADRVGVTYSGALANIAYYAVVLVTLLAAFERISLQFALLNQAIIIVLGGMALAFGLAVGLGGRDVVAGIMAGYYLRQRLQAGDFVTVGTLEGRVRDVGPVATIVETDEDGLMNRRSVPNTKMLHEAVR